ncbi:MAG: hypothetical protein SFU27_01240 [Thermonemataceae bacterium]|nr:hypothetical protein [Thermonemataceae bacterium]
MLLKVALLSVLKPIDDVRLFEKIGRTFLEQNYELHSIGFEGKAKHSSLKNVYFYPLFNFKRLSIKRLLAGWQVFFLLFKIKPHLLICASVELLFFCVLYKIFSPRKITIIYDIQENYYLNILYTEVYPKVIRFILAHLVRLSEKINAIFVDYFFLAESCYATEIPFLRSNFLILENKAIFSDFPTLNEAPNHTIKFCISGTIANAYGSEEGILLFKNIQKDSHLEVVGRCVEENLYKKIQLHKNPHITINIHKEPISHQSIMEAQSKADVILMPYRIQKAYQHRIPTKFYEAMALGKCMIIQKNSHWERFFITYNYHKVIFYDFFGDFDETLIERIEQCIRVKLIPQQSIFWESEKNKLLKYLEKLAINSV